MQLLCYKRELLLKWLRVPRETPLSDPLALLACMSGCDFVTDATTSYLQLRVEQVLRAGSRRHRGVTSTHRNLKAGTAGCTYVVRRVLCPVRRAAGLHSKNLTHPPMHPPL